MKLYYKAVTKEGKAIDGLIEARDEKEAASYLRSKEFIPITISKEEKTKLTDFIPLLSSKVKSKDILTFTRQMSTMLTSGITLIRCLEIMKDQGKNDALIEVLSGMIRDIEEGKSFSSAIARYPHVFSPVYISSTKAAETSGRPSTP